MTEVSGHRPSRQRPQFLSSDEQAARKALAVERVANASEKVLKTGSRNWSVLGHELRGSGPTLHGVRQDVKALINEAQQGNGEARHTLLTPVRILEEGMSSFKAVKRARDAAMDNKEEFGITILNQDRQHELSTKYSIDVFLGYSSLDQKTGEEGTRMPLYLVKNGVVVSDPRYWEGLEIEPDERSRYALEEVAGADYKLFIVHVEPQGEIISLPKA
jgi:hypothetical protein